MFHPKLFSNKYLWEIYPQWPLFCRTIHSILILLFPLEMPREMGFKNLRIISGASSMSDLYSCGQLVCACAKCFPLPSLNWDTINRIYMTWSSGCKFSIFWLSIPCLYVVSKAVTVTLSGKSKLTNSHIIL